MKKVLEIIKYFNYKLQLSFISIDVFKYLKKAPLPEVVKIFVEKIEKKRLLKVAALKIAKYEWLLKHYAKNIEITDYPRLKVDLSWQHAYARLIQPWKNVYYSEFGLFQTYDNTVHPYPDKFEIRDEMRFIGKSRKFIFPIRRKYSAYKSTFYQNIKELNRLNEIPNFIQEKFQYEPHLFTALMFYEDNMATYDKYKNYRDIQFPIKEVVPPIPGGQFSNQFGVDFSDKEPEIELFFCENEKKARISNPQIEGELAFYNEKVIRKYRIGDIEKGYQDETHLVDESLKKQVVENSLQKNLKIWHNHISHAVEKNYMPYKVFEKVALKNAINELLWGQTFLHQKLTRYLWEQFWWEDKYKKGRKKARRDYILNYWSKYTVNQHYKILKVKLDDLKHWIKNYGTSLMALMLDWYPNMGQKPYDLNYKVRRDRILYSLHGPLNTQTFWGFYSNVFQSRALFPSTLFDWRKELNITIYDTLVKTPYHKHLKITLDRDLHDKHFLKSRAHYLVSFFRNTNKWPIEKLKIYPFSHLQFQKLVRKVKKKDEKKAKKKIKLDRHFDHRNEYLRTIKQKLQNNLQIGPRRLKLKLTPNYLKRFEEFDYNELGFYNWDIQDPYYDYFSDMFDERLIKWKSDFFFDLWQTESSLKGSKLFSSVNKNRAQYNRETLKIPEYLNNLKLLSQKKVKTKENVRLSKLFDNRLDKLDFILNNYIRKHSSPSEYFEKLLFSKKLPNFLSKDVLRFHLQILLLAKFKN